MKKSAPWMALALALAAAGASAQEMGRVLSSVPIYESVAVPRQVCTSQPAWVQPQSSGVGSLIGAVAGGVLGNTVGHGSGRAVATAIGVIGGAAVGNQLENRGAQIQNVSQCSTQTAYESRALGYNVTYEYAGRQYTVQMPQDPGPWLPLQVSPMGAAGAYDPPLPVTVTSIGRGVVVGPTLIETGVVTLPPAVVYPVAPYPGPYYRHHQPRGHYGYPPRGVSWSLGYSSERHGHRHGRGHGPDTAVRIRGWQ